MNVLELKNVSAGFGSFPFLHDISISVGEKEAISIIGPNGSGKTTLLRAIVDQARKFGGDITFLGSSINGLKTYQIIKKGLTLVPERNRIFTYLSVLENLELGGYLIKDHSALEKKIEEIYATFPILKTRANQQAGTLSGGEQKMLSIARALISDPKLLMLDEPSMGLAPKVVSQLYDIILQFNKKGLPIVLVEQNIHKALPVTSETFLLNRGEIVMHAAPKELLQNPNLFSVYLKGY